MPNTKIQPCDLFDGVKPIEVYHTNDDTTVTLHVNVLGKNSENVITIKIDKSTLEVIETEII